MANTNLPFSPNSRVVAYLRDSGGQDQDLSVIQQNDFISKWCLENNLVLANIFADLARPGSSTVGRSQFLDMIKYFTDPDCQAQGVVLWNYARFSRSVDDSQYYRSFLRTKGFIVYSIQDDVPNDEFGRLYEVVIDIGNSRALKDTSGYVKRGMHYLINTYGGLPGTPPPGFKREPFDIGIKRNGSIHRVSRWIPNPDTIENCKKAWRMRAEGYSIKQIHEEFHIFATRQSYTTFFKNRLYLGELHYGDIVIEKYCEPQISQETWDSVQEINKVNTFENNPNRKSVTRNPRRVSSSYLLSGLAYCSKCGALMSGRSVTGRDRKRMTYYECTRAHAHMDCDAKRIPQKALDELVIKSLKDFILDPAIIAERSRQQAESRLLQKDSYLDDRRQLVQKMQDQKSRIINLVDKIAGDPDAPRSIVEKIKELEFDFAGNEVLLDRMKTSRDPGSIQIMTEDRARELSKYLINLIGSDDEETKQFILRGIIKSVSAERDQEIVRGLVVYWSPSETGKKKDH